MEEQKPAYYSITPAKIRYDRDLSSSAKLLYGEITALTNKEGYCWASNRYFAELYNVSESSISKWVSQLQKKGYINVIVDQENGNKRYITIEEKSQTSSKKVTDPSSKKLLHNNKDNNIKFNIISSELESSPNETNKLIDLFKQVNLNYKAFYKNKTQRKALEELLELKGYDYLEKALNFLPKIMEEKYAPVITTPIQLKDKLAQLEAFARKNKPKSLVAPAYNENNKTI